MSDDQPPNGGLLGLGPIITMKHEDIRTQPPTEGYRPINDPMEMERRIIGLENRIVGSDGWPEAVTKLQAQIDTLTKTVELMSHVITHMQQAQARTIERMLKVMEEPQ